MILSASRRTDLPAFYSEWFLNRLEAGELLVRNPMNRAQIRRVTLSPAEVDCIVFWTKDPLAMLPRLSRIEELGYPFYFQFTLTPYGGELEPGLRSKRELLSTFQELSRLLGPERLLWRYDPIVLNREWTAQRHAECFAAMCRRLSGYTRVCTISFVDYYQKRKQVFQEGILRELLPEEMASVSETFSRIGGAHGIELRACCEAMDLTAFGVKRASCIDPETIERICGHRVALKPDANQRPGCGCAASVDVGAYDSCMHGCVYCYANRMSSLVERNAAAHDPKGELLI